MWHYVSVFSKFLVENLPLVLVITSATPYTFRTTMWFIKMQSLGGCSRLSWHSWQVATRAWWKILCACHHGESEIAVSSSHNRKREGKMLTTFSNGYQTKKLRWQRRAVESSKPMRLFNLHLGSEGSPVWILIYLTENSKKHTFKPCVCKMGEGLCWMHT